MVERKSIEVGYAEHIFATVVFLRGQFSVRLALLRALPGCDTEFFAANVCTQQVNEPQQLVYDKQLDAERNRFME